MFSWIRQVLAWLVILGVVLVLAVAVLVPRLAGATPYTVLTGSMRPAYPPGTLVVVKQVDPKELSVGDVVTYQRESGEATVVTHRIVSIGNQLDGDLVLTTQGDANDVPDQEPVKPVQVRGRLWYAVPYLGHVNNLMTGQQRQIAVLAVSTGLVGYAAFMFVGAVRDRRRRSGEEPDAPSEQAGSDTTGREPAPQVHNGAPARRRRVRQPGLAAVLAASTLVATVLLLLRRRTGRGVL